MLLPVHPQLDHPTAAGPLVLDLRYGLRLWGPDDASPGLRVPDAVALGAGDLLLGAAAADALARDPGAGWAGFLDRLDDPTPVLLGGAAHRPEELLARVAAAAAGPLAELWLVPPAWLSRPGRDRLTVALAGAGLPLPRLVDDVEVELGPCPDRQDAAHVLVQVGPRSTVARRVTATPVGWHVTATATGPVGTDDLDDAVVAFVEARLSGRRGALAAGDGWALRSACTDGRRRLAAVPAVEVRAAGLPPVRLVRADLDGAAARLAAAIAPLVPAGDADVWLAGDGIALPGLVQALSARLGRPCALIPDAAGAARLRALLAPADEAGPPPEPPLPAPAGAHRLVPARRRPLRQVVAVAAVACSLATAGTALAVPQVREAAVRLLDPAGQPATAQAKARPAPGTTTAPGTDGGPFPGAVLPLPSAWPTPASTPGAPAPSGVPDPSEPPAPADTPASRTGRPESPGGTAPGGSASPAPGPGTPSAAPAASPSTRGSSSPTMPATPTQRPTTPPPAAPTTSTPTTSTPTTAPASEPTPEPTQEPTQEPTLQPTTPAPTEPAGEG